MLNPFLQGVISLFISLITTLLAYRAKYEYLIYAGAFGLFLFLFINPLLGIKEEHFWLYTTKSFLTLIVLMFACIFLTELAKKLFHTLGSGESMMIYLAPIIYYPVMVAVSLIIRFIIKL